MPIRTYLSSLLLAGFVISVSLSASAQQFDPALFQELHWRLIGPFRGGRTVAIDGIPDQPHVFFMAANNGGVWKTSDAGRTWDPIFDGQPTGSIGALALAPSNPNIIYVGSGEGLRRPDLSVGNGIYKSTNGGKTWEHLGLRDGQQISRILVDPKDPDRLFVAVVGHPYGPNAERGVFRSLDGGKTFDKVLYKDENTGAVDLAFDPANPQTVYAVMWASRRPPWSVGNPFKAAGSGLFRSTDGGSTWQPLTKGLPTFQEGLGRIGITIAATDPKRMYALVEAKSCGLFRSDDAGESWQRVNSENRICGRGSDFAWVRVDPKDKDLIYVANTTTYRSTDGGKGFVGWKGAPGGDDYHTIWINPNDPNIILLGADQGATLTLDGGRTWSSWYNQPTAQFYHVITDNQFPYWVYGGQQESGSVGTASRSDYGEITFRDWHTVGVEEYGYVAPDPLDPAIIYGGKATRYDTHTGQTKDVSPVVIRSNQYRFNRTAPLIFSHADPHTLYLGSSVLFKTTNGGQSWQIISPDLTREDPGVPPNLGEFANDDPRHGKHRGVIYSIGPSFRDPNTIWVGTDDGLIHLTRDGGKTWQNITPPELTPWSKVAQIEASHFDENTCYAAINRLRLDDLHPYIYRTHDGGKTWQKIVAGLPDEPVNSVREDPERKGLLFAGTERTVYVSFDDGDRWQSLQQNLPSTSIRDLVVHGDDIVVGTHGRSFWILDDITPLRQLSTEVTSADAHLFAPQVAYRVRRSTNTDTPLPPETPAGQNPPDGGVLDYFLKAASPQPVVLEIYDAGGVLVRRYSSSDKPKPYDPKEYNVPMYWAEPLTVPSAEAGLHRFVWDLHFPVPEGMDLDFPISAIPHDTPLEPLGPRAVAGQYTVKLIVNGKTYSQPLTLKMDPRVKATPEDLEQQFKAEMAIADSLRRADAAEKQVEAVREQIKKLSGAAEAKKLGTQLEALDKKAAALQGPEQSFESMREPGAAPTLKQVLANLNTIYSVVDSADARPTDAALAALATAQQELDSLAKQWQALQAGDLAPVNTALRNAKQPELKVAPAQAAPAPH